MPVRYVTDYEQLYAHHSMLADRARTDAFRSAIDRMVTPGDVVVDLGAGTGILSVFAARAGAAQVYAIERTAIIDVARRVVADSGVDNVVFLDGDSHDVELPGPCDVLVSECIGAFGIQENMVSDVLAFRARWLRDDSAAVLPGTLDLWVTPVHDPNVHRYVTFWDAASDVYDLELGALRALASNTSHTYRFAARAALAAPRRLSTVDLRRDTTVAVDGAVTFECTADQVLHGFAGSFSASLCEGVTLDAGIGTRTHWGQEYFPCHSPLGVRAGDTVTFALAAEPQEGSVAWAWQVSVNGDEVERHGPDET
jgi:SAM-dependent methyltransferase